MPHFVKYIPLQDVTPHETLFSGVNNGYIRSRCDNEQVAPQNAEKRKRINWMLKKGTQWKAS